MRKLVSILLTLAMALSLTLVVVVPVEAADPTTVASSTMVFQDITGYTLTYDSVTGTYSGIIPMVGDIGFDVYAREGDIAHFSEDPDVTISSHDGWPSWNPDTPDWYQYSLELKDGKWAVRNHPGATATNPWYDTSFWSSAKPACGVPMSGTMDWNVSYAAETDTGAYLPSMGTPKNSGWAATNGGGASCWDMDWSWGSEVVPLQFPGFDVTITGSAGAYTVTMTPAAAGTTALTVEVPDIIAISVDPTSIDFGSLVPGATSAEKQINVENVGTHTVDIDVEVDGAGLFESNLLMRDSSSYATSGGDNIWPDILTGLAMGSLDSVYTKLPVPVGYTPNNTETATLIFTAKTA